MTEQTIKKLDFVEMGHRIRQRREYLGLSREVLAEKLDVSPQFIADVEYGNKGLSLKNFYALCQVLGVPSDFILSGEINDSDDELLRAREKVMSILGGCDCEQLDGVGKIVEIYIDGTKMK